MIKKFLLFITLVTFGDTVLAEVNNSCQQVMSFIKNNLNTEFSLRRFYPGHNEQRSKVSPFEDGKVILLPSKKKSDFTYRYLARGTQAEVYYQFNLEDDNGICIIRELLREYDEFIVEKNIKVSIYVKNNTKGLVMQLENYGPASIFL